MVSRTSFSFEFFQVTDRGMQAWNSIKSKRAIITLSSNTGAIQALPNLFSGGRPCSWAQFMIKCPLHTRITMLYHCVKVSSHRSLYEQDNQCVPRRIYSSQEHFLRDHLAAVAADKISLNHSWWYCKHLYCTSSNIKQDCVIFNNVR